ncbi:MAG: hypothetical protein Q7U74_05215, partial [Saprospiraceae bacterium]|nr:hypothetical protein [Saprospiraceae bacterium]
MKNPFKKIFDMMEKEPNTPDQSAQENAADHTEMIENQENMEQNAAPEPQGQTTELQKQLEESRNKYLYLFSDFENYKRNAARERMDLISTA